MYPTVDRAFKHVITSESSGDKGDLSPYRVVKLKSPRISSQSPATLNLLDELVVAGVESIHSTHPHWREVGGVDSGSDPPSFLIGMWIGEVYSRPQGDQSTSALLLHA